MGRLVLNHSSYIEGLIPILKNLALNINIRSVTPAIISRVKGRSSIARKGKTAQEVFISTDLSKDELKSLLDDYNRS